MNKKLLAVAGGNHPADIVVKNGKLVNVYTGEIYDGGVAVADDRIAAVGDVDYTIGEGTRVIDAAGRYITPGFIDGHIHPESTSLSIRSFAELMLYHGTTTIMTDLHEIGVVAGLEGIEAVLDEAKDTDLKVCFVVPSHVPFSPDLETSGGHFNTEIITKALQREDAVGLSECVGPYILAQYPDLMDSMDVCRSMRGMTLQGHLPDMEGPAMNVCLAAGVSTDHEALGEDSILRLRNGCHTMIREGSAARGLVEGLKPILENNLDTFNVSIVTDDLHTCDAVEKGHLDASIRVALSAGLPFVKAIQMVSVNAARAFNMEQEIGSLAPGRRADINLTTGPEDFRVETVIAGGQIVKEDGKLIVNYKPAKHADCILNTIKRDTPVTAEDFMIRVPKQAKKARVKVMDTLKWIPITQEREVTLDVKDGIVQCDVSQDVLYIAQVERYGINGNIGKAFMGGFTIKDGAIASTVGHDNHNIIVLGTNFEDMAAAVNYLIEIGGGQCVVRGGKVTGKIEYPICGLLTDKNAKEVADIKAELNGKIREMGCEIEFPFMFLSFISLSALPCYAITDRGFINVLMQSIEDPILEILQ